MKILLVEDDPGTRLVVARVLERAGYHVTVAADGTHALDVLASLHPALVILDVGLPGIDGFEVCRRIRCQSQVPVVMFTARDSEEAVMHGYDLAIDDYVTKPCSPQILVARVAAVLRRGAEGKRRERERSIRLHGLAVDVERSIRLGGLVIDVDRYEVRLDDVPVPLPPRDFRLLFLLAANAGRVVPYGRLIEYAWQHEGAGLGSLKIHAHHLRRKLEDAAPGAVAIQAVIGAGYRLVAADSSPARRYASG